MPQQPQPSSTGLLKTVASITWLNNLNHRIRYLITTMSLKSRSVLMAFLSVTLAIPISFVILQSTYKHHVESQIAEQLEIQCLMLLSEIELEGEQLLIPEQLPISAFNLPNSGLYASVFQANNRGWSSASTLTQKAPAPSLALSLGEGHFSQPTINEIAYFNYQFVAEFFDGNEFVPVAISILLDSKEFNLLYQQFLLKLSAALALLGLVIIVVISGSLMMTSYPLSHLKKQISALKNHHITEIDTVYPAELNSVKEQLNSLLKSEQVQRERYKNSLGDLAHGLKTPLAVLNAMTDLPPSAQPLIQQLDQQIQRQLKRASAGMETGHTGRICPNQSIRKVIDAMKKIYREKQLKFTFQPAHEDKIQIDATDLLELLGNLIDNACKAAHQQVHIVWITNNGQSILSIEDDGPGIPEQQKQVLLERGRRLDSYQEGQGIGLAVVWDLLLAYRAQLVFEKSSLGGARVVVKFNCHK